MYVYLRRGVGVDLLKHVCMSTYMYTSIYTYTHTYITHICMYTCAEESESICSNTNFGGGTLRYSLQVIRHVSS